MKTKLLFIFCLFILAFCMPAYSTEQDGNPIYPSQREYKHEAFLKWLHDRPFHTIGMDPPKFILPEPLDQKEENLERAVEEDLLIIKHSHVTEIRERDLRNKEKCRYFYTSSIENDNLILAFIDNPGNDSGYTHGHFRSLTKSCSSGQDISISWDSRAFTDYEYSKIQLEDGNEIHFSFYKSGRIRIWNAPDLIEYEDKFLELEKILPLPSDLEEYGETLEEYGKRVWESFPPPVFPLPPDIKEYEKRIFGGEQSPQRHRYRVKIDKSSKEYQEYRKRIQEWQSSENYRKLYQEYRKRIQDFYSNDYQKYRDQVADYTRRVKEWRSSEAYEKRLEEFKASEDYRRRVKEWKSSKAYKRQLEEFKASEDYQEYEELINTYMDLIKEAKKVSQITTVINFEEQNELSLILTNWRTLNQIYQTMGLVIGNVSRRRFYGAVKEQELFHKILAGDIKGIYKYEYYKEKGKEDIYVGGILASGITFPLGDYREHCDGICRDYFRIEGGVKLSTLPYDTHVHAFAEVDKTLPSPFDMISLFATAKVSYNSTLSQVFSTGLRADLGGPFHIHFLVKHRDLLDREDRTVQYDKDKDLLTVIGFTIEGDLVKNPSTLGFSIK